MLKAYLLPSVSHADASSLSDMHRLGIRIASPRQNLHEAKFSASHAAVVFYMTHRNECILRKHR